MRSENRQALIISASGQADSRLAVGACKGTAEALRVLKILSTFSNSGRQGCRMIALRRVFVIRAASQQGTTVAHPSSDVAALESSLGYPRFGRPDILVKLTDSTWQKCKGLPLPTPTSA